MPNPALCLITGATQGLGYALAVDAAQRGAHVVAVGRNQAALDELADQIDAFQGAVTLVPMDLCDDDAIAYLAQSIIERWGKLDYWFHTAWFTAQMQPTPNMLAGDLDKAYKTNIRMTARLIHHLQPILRLTKNARAVFFDDRKNHGPHMSNIGLSKSAQMELVTNWKLESQRIGPKVEISSPLPFRGQLRATLYPGEDQSLLSTPAREAERVLDILM